MSHELMHSHVRNLLGALFRGDSTKTPEENFKQMYVEYLEGHQVEGLQNNDEHLPDSLRNVLFTYCAYRDQYPSFFSKNSTLEKEGREEDYIDIYPHENPSAALQSLCRYFKDINEIMVHVLDFHYFYNCDAKMYVGLIWSSWATVPVVLEATDTYLLRTLLAVGTEIDLPQPKRFEKTLENVKGFIESIHKVKPVETTKKALESLEVPGHVDDLQNRFDISIPLADMTCKWLCFDDVYSSLMGDPDNIDRLTEFYNLKTGVFANKSILSPVAFLLDRGRNALKSDKPTLELSYRSAWLLMACASSAQFLEDKENGDEEISG